MLKICTVFLLLLTVSCANFERRLADDLVKSGQIKLNRCEVEGFDYSGIDSYLTKGKLLKVLMIHGIGTHHPGYSRLIQQNLADASGLNVISRTAQKHFPVRPFRQSCPHRQPAYYLLAKSRPKQKYALLRAYLVGNHRSLQKNPFF